MSEFGNLAGPRQFAKDGAQSDESPDAGRGSQRRSLCTQAGHPSENVRIAAYLLEANNLWVCGADIDEEAARRDVVVACGGRTERGGKRFDGVCHGRSQRMLERGATPALHEEILGCGWMHCAAARAY